MRTEEAEHRFIAAHELISLSRMIGKDEGGLLQRPYPPSREPAFPWNFIKDGCVTQLVCAPETILWLWREWLDDEWGPGPSDKLAGLSMAWRRAMCSEAD